MKNELNSQLLLTFQWSGDVVKSVILECKIATTSAAFRCVAYILPLLRKTKRYLISQENIGPFVDKDLSGVDSLIAFKCITLLQDSQRERT